MDSNDMSAKSLSVIPISLAIDCYAGSVESAADGNMLNVCLELLDLVALPPTTSDATSGSALVELQVMVNDTESGVPKLGTLNATVPTLCNESVTASWRFHGLSDNESECCRRDPDRWCLLY
jgi:hypothetical protein